MLWLKRISLFLTVGFLTVVTLSFFLTLFGIRSYLGYDYLTLVSICSAWCLVSSFISLFISKKVAKWNFGVQTIEANTEDPRLTRILQSVACSAKKAKLTTMPEIGIYNSPEVNAFAIGSSRDDALVAISTELFKRLSPEEVDGVIGHEIAHIANGDMVTMVILQGASNAFALFLVRSIAFLVATLFGSKHESPVGAIFSFVCRVAFGLENLFVFLSMLMVAACSRSREFRADRDCAKLIGRGKMLSALHALHRTLGVRDPKTQDPALYVFKITDPPNRFLKLLSTHPSLQERIIRIQKLPRDTMAQQPLPEPVTTSLKTPMTNPEVLSQF